jgi:hypothetical protein
MKNIKKAGFALTAMMLMMGFLATSVFAQVPQTDPLDQRTIPQEEREHFETQEHETFPQEQYQVIEEDDVDYSVEIEETELPANVSTSLNELYPEHEVTKVYRGNDNSYKVKVENGDEKSVIYYSSDGEFLKVEEGRDKNATDTDTDTEW